MNSQPDNAIQYINIPTACRFYGFGRTYCYKLLSGGHIKAKKLGGRTLISVDSINAYFDSLPDFKTAGRS